MIKTLPKDITSYDLFKTFAILTMIIDHIGAYFFPEQLWFRAIGRMSFPVWLFLIGYARSRDLPMKLFIGAGILILADYVVGLPILPLNILVTIAITRLLIDRVAEFSLRGSWYLWGTATFLFLAVLPTAFVSDYGTRAIIIALAGYYLRHRESIANDRLIFQYMVFAFLSFIIVQHIMFGFSSHQLTFMTICVGLVHAALYYFKPLTLSGFTAKCPSSVVWFLQLCGRRLELQLVGGAFLGGDVVAWPEVDGLVDGTALPVGVEVT